MTIGGAASFRPGNEDSTAAASGRQRNVITDRLAAAARLGATSPPGARAGSKRVRRCPAARSRAAIAVPMRPTPASATRTTRSVRLAEQRCQDLLREAFHGGRLVCIRQVHDHVLDALPLLLLQAFQDRPCSAPHVDLD